MHEGTPAPYRPAPPLTPSLVESAPWFYELPGTTADLWRRIYDDDPAAALVLPSSQFVTDGTRLYVRKAGCSRSGTEGYAEEAVTALDLQDLMVSWESSQRRQGRNIRATRSAPARRIVPASQPQAERVEDYIGGTISIAHGLVFTVERGGAGGGTDAQNAPAALPPNFGPAGRRSTGVNPMATRLVAYDAQSGELRWQRGAGGDSDDEFSDVQFRAAPIGVGDHVWVPYFKQSDLFVAVLNPSDGSLVRSVLLGSARQPLNFFAPTLLPAVSDGLVFVPSGCGALFALDAADATVRWACQYERGSRPRRDPRTAPVTAWLPSPPVVAGGLVLLAATDHRELSAFSAGSGEFRWTATVEHGSYVIAADSTRLWLGGRNISCLSIADGKPVWATRLIAVPTGRGVVSGELVFVPTSEGLLSLDAATGAAIGVQPTPPSQTPLGDLLCVGTALFSIDPSSVRKFPDLERTHAAALARRETLPTDPSAAMQLAWVELLRGEPGRADEVLQQISTAALAKDPHRMDSFARVRVETAIALAGKAVSGSAEALQWLQVADAVALTGADRLRCRLAIADQHIAGGRYAEAYGNLVQLGLSAEADQMVRAAESVETAARTQIVERLRELHAKLNTEQTSRLADEINRQLSEARQRLQDGREVEKARAQLQALAYLPTVGTAAKRALFELADWERRQLRFERAEQFLLEGARHRFDPSAVAAYLGLCELYNRSAQDQISALMPCLEELEKRFGSEPVPEKYSPPPAPTSTAQSRPLVSEWVAQVRSAIPSAVRDAFLSSANGKASDLVERRELSNDAAWAYHAAEGSYLGRIVRVDPEGSPLLRDRILLYRSDGVLECLSAGGDVLAERPPNSPLPKGGGGGSVPPYQGGRQGGGSVDGELLWQTRLRLPEEFAESTLVTTPPLEPARRAVADGQIVVLNGADGLFAVGLVTGRRLWMKPRDTFREINDTYKQDRAMAAADGLLAAAPRQGKLTLMRMIDGSTVWERDLRGEPVDAIWMSADRVITADAARQRVHLFDRADGRLVNRILFQSAEGGSQPIVQLVRTGGMIVGPEASGPTRGIVAVDDALGDVVWRVELDKPPMQLFEPQEGYLGIGLGQGMVRIVDANSGETVLERQVLGAYGVTGGVLFDGLLVVRVDTIRGQKQFAQLAALDVATGEEVWRREDISSLPYPEEPLRIEDGVIPALVEAMQAEVTPSGVATPRMRSTLVLLDARTGRNLGLGADLTSTGMGGRFTGDVVLRPGAVVVGTQRTVNAYRAKVAKRDGTGRSY